MNLLTLLAAANGTTSGDGGGTGQPATDVQFLAHFNGSNGSTVHTDSSTYNRAIITAGGAAISTASPLVGTGSIALNDVGKYVTVQVPAIGFASGQWCFEWTCNQSTVSQDFAYFTLSGAGGDLYCQRYFNMFYVGDGVAINNIAEVFPADIVANTTYNMALTYDGTTYRFFVNGAIKFSTTTQLSAVSGSTLTIGGRPGFSWNFNGKVDEFRLTTGTARYTGPYTPSVPFPDPVAGPVEPITFIGANGGDDGGSTAGPAIVNIPSGTLPGDLIVCLAITANFSAARPPEFFATKYLTNWASYGYGFGVFTKIASGETSITVPGAASAIVLVFRGAVDTGSVGTLATSGGSTLSLNGITPTKSTSKVLALITDRDPSIPQSPAGWTSHLAFMGTYFGFQATSKPFNSTSATGPVVVNVTSAPYEAAGILIEIIN